MPPIQLGELHFHRQSLSGLIWRGAGPDAGVNASCEVLLAHSGDCFFELVEQFLSLVLFLSLC
jgi:hypothetical protein